MHFCLIFSIVLSLHLSIFAPRFAFNSPHPSFSPGSARALHNTWKCWEYFPTSLIPAWYEAGRFPMLLSWLKTVTRTIIFSWPQRGRKRINYPFYPEEVYIDLFGAYYLIFLHYVKKHGIECPMKSFHCIKFNFTSSQGKTVESYKLTQIKSYLLLCRKNFRSRRWGSSLPGLRTRDPPLSPQSMWAEIFRRTCLQSHLQTSPPTPQKSYPKFRNPRKTFANTPLVRPKVS